MLSDKDILQLTDWKQTAYRYVESLQQLVETAEDDRVTELARSYFTKVRAATQEFQKQIYLLIEE